MLNSFEFFFFSQMKLLSAASIVSSGKNVTIVRHGSSDAQRAIKMDEELDRATVLHPRLEEGRN
jgi:hypothetical protein